MSMTESPLFKVALSETCLALQGSQHLASTYTKSSVPLLRLDAQFTVIEAALKGCLKWLMSPGNATIVS